MRLNYSPISKRSFRFVLCMTMIVFALVIAACGSSATPTAVLTPAIAGQPTPSIAAQPTAPVTLPAVPPLPTVEPTGAVVGSPTPTKFAVAVASPTSSAVIKPTLTPAPKPVALSGKLVYTVVTGDAPDGFVSVEHAYHPPVWKTAVVEADYLTPLIATLQAKTQP